MELSSDSALCLHAEPFDLAWEDIPAYGTPLAEVIRRHGHDRSWLEAAVYAGHLPFLEGIDFVLLGLQAMALAEIRHCEAEDVAGDALRWADASGYRRLIALLERLAAELDAERDRILGPGA